MNKVGMMIYLAIGALLISLIATILVSWRVDLFFEAVITAALLYIIGAGIEFGEGERER